MAKIDWSNKEIVIELIKEHPWIIKMEGVDPKIYNDKEIMIEAVKQNGNLLELASSELKKDKEVVLEAIKKDGTSLQYAEPELRKDKEIVLEAIKNDGMSLQYADQELRANKEFVMQVFKQRQQQNGNKNDEIYYMSDLSEKLQLDKEIQMEAIKTGSWENIFNSKNKSMRIGEIIEEVKDNREVMLALIKAHPNFYKDASRYLKQNKEFVEEVVKQNPVLYTEIAPEYQSTREIALEAMKQRPATWNELPEVFKKEEEFSLEAIKEGYGDIDSKFKSDKEFMKKAVELNGVAIAFSDKLSKEDREELALKAVETYGKALEFVKPELQADREFVLKAINLDGAALRYASSELRNDPEIVLEAMKQNKNAFEYAGKELQGNKEFILEAVKYDVSAVKRNVNPELLEDKEYLLKLIKQNGKAMELASKELKGDILTPGAKGDEDFKLEAIKANPEALKYMAVEYYETRPDELKWTTKGKEILAESAKENEEMLSYVKQKYSKQLETEEWQTIRDNAVEAIITKSIEQIQQRTNQEKEVTKAEKKLQPSEIASGINSRKGQIQEIASAISQELKSQNRQENLERE